MFGVFINLCLPFPTKFVKKMSGPGFKFLWLCPCCFTRMGNVWPVHRAAAVWHPDIFLFSLSLSSQNSALPDARFHSTLVKLLTGSKLWVHEVHLAEAFSLPTQPPCSSLVCISLEQLFQAGQNPSFSE